jgi:NADH-quinone oxidoreductase subunit E
MSECKCGHGEVEEKVTFPTELVAFIDEWKAKQGSLIMILHRTQETFGFIPRSAAEQIAAMTAIPLSRIYGVVTFYHFFKTTKPGKNKISVCLGTACYLKGSGDLLEETRKVLNVRPNEVTSDGMFSVEEVRCVGCCGLAPVMTVNKDTYGKLGKKQLPEIFDKYR